jgi:hypothetical protein
MKQLPKSIAVQVQKLRLGKNKEEYNENKGRGSSNFDDK